jgi:chromosome segregation ATPase
VAKQTELEKTQAKVAEIDAEIARLEDQLKQARDAATAASRRMVAVGDRQNELAIAIVGGDEEAARQNEELEEILVVETRRQATASSAVSQLQALIGEQQKLRKEAVKAVESAQADEIAEEVREYTRQLDERLEGIEDLFDLASARMVTRRQHLVRAGKADPSPTAGINVGATLRNYLVQRLGTKWSGDSLPHGYHYPKTLAQAFYLERPDEDSVAS